ncbi:MAG: hypothetical protein SOR61_05740 [Evtepia sp.]|uniref:hypothetical protein n=1 Tax=Evtepia sp. TaxID=2773933 RepID=UPI002A75F257|nr:hypothetical protein [Evtepia sp.]MDY3014678.1 hypothetical protein [Evtepia sp.]
MTIRQKKKAGVWLSVLAVLLLVAGYAVFSFRVQQGLGIPLFLLLIPGIFLLAGAAGILLAARSRMKEINGGEEDDLSQY